MGDTSEPHRTLKRHYHQSRNSAKFADIVRYDGDAINDCGGSNPKVIGADHCPGGCQVTIELPILPRDLKGPGKNGKGLAETLPVGNRSG